jgi:hypothetical protein
MFRPFSFPFRRDVFPTVSSIFTPATCPSNNLQMWFDSHTDHRLSPTTKKKRAGKTMSRSPQLKKTKGNTMRIVDEALATVEGN